jgi:hypothetical protein
MTPAEAIAFVEKHGVVLMSAKGSVPRLTEAIINEPIKGSWWGHPRSHEIFAVLETVADSSDILVCRLIDGKITLVHRRLWPALIRIADRFPKDRLAQVHQEHTSSGKHVNREVPFPRWVPAEVKKQAGKIGEDEALRSFGLAPIVPKL